MSATSLAANLMSPRAVRFQLTALMDLLLIIVFAQFLELRQRADEAKVTQRQEIQTIKNDFETKTTAIQTQADQERQRQSELLERSMQVLRNSFASAAADQPQAPIQEVVQQQMKQMADTDSESLIRFLVGYDELLKRADVWTVHAKATGEITLKAGERVEAFRLEAGRQSERVTEFEDEFYQAYRHLPQPKGLVVMLVSYDFRSTAGVYQVMVDAVPNAVERMRLEAPQIRFEYTILGPMGDPNLPE